MPPRFEATDVRSYYERHTRDFITYGEGGEAGAIHRAVWGPGIDTREQAFRYVEDRIVDLLAGAPHAAGDAHVVDLGCGIASSLCYLATRVAMRGTGVTISPLQVRHATRHIREAGLADRIRCVEGDFSALPSDIPPADVVFAIESFVHGPDPAAFLASCRDVMRPGGMLLICDDFRRPVTDPSAASAIDRFCRGWHVNTLIEPEELVRLASSAGLTHEGTADLTDHLELGRPRDRMIALLVAALGWVPTIAARYDNLVGGAALQECLTRGWIGYDLATFRRAA